MILFGIPTFAGSPCEEFLPAYIDTLGQLGAAGIASSAVFIPRDPYLSKARNKVVTKFLTEWPQATHLFFLDDDIGWPGHKVVEFIRRDLDVVVGAYPKKTDAGEFPCQLDTEDGKLVERDGLYRAVLAPTGFMCIKRHVIERLAALSGQYLDTTKPDASEWQFNVFDMGFFMPSGERPTKQAGMRGQFWGEDYYFVRKWRDLGGEVWIDPDIDFSHRGSKAWRGNLQSAIGAWQDQTKDQCNERDTVEPRGTAA